MENSYNNNSIISKKELTETELAELNNGFFIACQEGELDDAKSFSDERGGRGM